MKTRLSMLVTVALVLAGSMKGEETIVIDGRYDSHDDKSHRVWIGVFVGPINEEAKAWSWTSVDSTNFSLEVPNVDEVQLMAFRKGSLPVVQRVESDGGTSEIVLEFRKGKTIQGTLFSTDGIPVPNVRLTLERKDQRQVQMPVRAQSSWTTNESGHFEISGLSAGTYDIHVDLPYIPDETISIRVSKSNVRRQDLTLADAYFVIGHVVDQSGSGVSSAAVNFVASSESRNVHTPRGEFVTTDAAGEFRVGPLLRGSQVWISGWHEEKGSSRRIAAIAGSQRVELTLTGTVHLTGTVVDATTGQPITELTLVAIGEERSRRIAIEGSRGIISETVDVRTSGLVIDSKDHIAHFNFELDLGSSEKQNLGVIALEPGKQLSGLVYDSATGQPIDGATVCLGGYELGGTDNFVATNFVGPYVRETVRTTTDSHGKYVLKPLPFVSAQVIVNASGYQGQELQVGETETLLDIPLESHLQDGLSTEKNARIRGRIETISGELISGVVTIRNRQGHSSSGSANSDGRFDRSTRAGALEVFAVTDLGKSNTLKISLEENEIREVTLYVDAKGRLRGDITGLEDGELMSIRVFAGATQVRRLVGLENGAFVIEGVGLGELSVNARTTKSRYIVRTIKVDPHSQEAFVELSFGGNSRLYGKLRHADGSVPEGEVRAIPIEKGSASNWSRIERDGRYEIGGLDDGEYIVLTEHLKKATYSIGGDTRSVSRTTTVQVGKVSVSGDTELDIQIPESTDSE